jgi:predicted nucleotide-binding protein
MSKREIINEILRSSKNEGTVGYSRLKERVRTFVQFAYDDSELVKYNQLISVENKSDLSSSMGKIIGYLEGLLARETSDYEDIDRKPSQYVKYDTTKVFIVHGHDTETKETVARFIQKIGLKPIILHEQPSSGFTIIEKLESFSNVGYALILLTPDDVGGDAHKKNDLHARARQNVIFELGYFIGKLSRKRVCALHKQDVEIPTDYGSVVFIELDEKGGWKTKLAQEFVHAGMSIEIEGLLEN